VGGFVFLGLPFFFENPLFIGQFRPSLSPAQSGLNKSYASGKFSDQPKNTKPFIQTFACLCCASALVLSTPSQTSTIFSFLSCHLPAFWSSPVSPVQDLCFPSDPFYMAHSMTRVVPAPPLPFLRWKALTLAKRLSPPRAGVSSWRSPLTKPS